MQHRISVIALVLASAGVAAQGGWKLPDTVTATITERYADRPERTIQVMSKGGGLLLHTYQAINGQLEGVPRMEAISRDGIFTWVEGSPGIALQLFAPTSFVAFEYLARPRFSRADLEFNLKGIEKALGKRVMVGKFEEVAGRECLVLTVMDRPDSMSTDYQKVWIDRETGIAMRQQDYFGGKLTYEREITSIDYRTRAATGAFRPQEGAVVIRGIVSPQTLLRLPNGRPHAEFKSDIAGVNAQAEGRATMWASAFNSSRPFRYAQTSYRKVQGKPILIAGFEGSSNRRSNQFADTSQQYMMLLSEQPTRVMEWRTDGDRTIRGQIAISASGDRREFVVIRDAEGNIRFQGPPGSGAGGTGAGQGGEGTTSLVAKSDFVDPKSGDTLTFVQVYGGPAEMALGPIVLGAPTVVKDQRLSGALAYRVTLPFEMNVLIWRKNEVSYALISTRLSLEELKSIAGSIKKS
ncbi:MAG: hypothetical protein IH851_01665 [Armatimonadetes bacterium]|nr:hypothetical protein [Armatimonadota bacterium]